VRAVTFVSNPKGNNNLGVLRIQSGSSESEGENLKRGAPIARWERIQICRRTLERVKPQKGQGKPRAGQEENPEEVEGQESCCCPNRVKLVRVQSAPKREKKLQGRSNPKMGTNHRKVIRGLARVRAASEGDPPWRMAIKDCRLEQERNP
jgi:hypothetical protein